MHGSNIYSIHRKATIDGLPIRHARFGLVRPPNHVPALKQNSLLVHGGEKLR
jgi:hypothetical protein